MSAASQETLRDIALVQQALVATGVRLHGIASRTRGEQVAAEVLRLNDAVRAGAAGRIAFDSQPHDFDALLLERADRFDAEAA